MRRCFQDPETKNWVPSASRRKVEQEVLFLTTQMFLENPLWIRSSNTVYSRATQETQTLHCALTHTLTPLTKIKVSWPQRNLKRYQRNKGLILVYFTSWPCYSSFIVALNPFNNVTLPFVRHLSPCLLYPPPTPPSSLLQASRQPRIPPSVLSIPV